VKLPGRDRLPIFRSDAQAAVLAELYVYASRPLSLTDLAERTGLSTAVVHKDVERLEAAGLVVSTREGRSRLVRSNEASPYAADLSSLLFRAFGPVVLLRRHLETLAGIDRAFIYGSWARSDHGSTEQPNDIDLMVIGAPQMSALYEQLRAVESRIRHPISVTVLTEDEWNADTGFLNTIREGLTLPVAPIDDTQKTAPTPRTTHPPTG